MAINSSVIDLTNGTWNNSRAALRISALRATILRASERTASRYAARITALG
jgi:hypothetical protein